MPACLWDKSVVGFGLPLISGFYFWLFPVGFICLRLLCEIAFSDCLRATQKLCCLGFLVCKWGENEPQL